MPELIVAAIRGPVLVLRRPSGLALARFERWQTAAGIGAAIASCEGAEVWAITDREDDSLAPGQILTRAEPEIVPLPPERLVELGLALTGVHQHGSPQIGETGIKVIDVLAPLVDGGLTWVLGGANVGRAQMLDELRLRCARQRIAQTLVFPLLPSSAAAMLERPGQPDEAPFGPPGLSLPSEASNGVRSLWLISEHVDNPTLAEIDALGHTRLFCSPRPPARGYWPAIDPLASRSRALSEALVDSAHVKLAFAVLETLAWIERMRADSLFDQLAAARSFEAAKLRTIELDVKLRLGLGDEQREQLIVAEQLERFLGQPLFVDRRRPDLHGTHVGLIDALVGCRDILAGRPPSGGFDYPARPGS